MIRTVAEFLHELMNEQRTRLDAVQLGHAPTIGAMYEGLTTEILGRAIPEALDLRIVGGFVVDGLGGMSGQIDCMLVRGEGTTVPFTNSFWWHVRDVVAVIEVKKNLYGDELLNAFEHLHTIDEMQHSWLQSKHGVEDVVDARAATKAFAQVTGTVAPTYEELPERTFEHQLLFHTLISEFMSPIKIVLGYHGFKTEHGFRESLFQILTDKIGARGFGVGSFPQLIVSNRFTLAKANGLPYSIPMRGDLWDFYFSTPTNPLVLILEFIWTRLAREYNLGGLWGDDLVGEVAHPFLAARPVQREGANGWELQYCDLTHAELTAQAEPSMWTPEYLTLEEFVVVSALCNGTAVRLDDPDLEAYMATNGLELRNVAARLIETNLVALSGQELELITEACFCAVLPNGEFVAAENNSGRLSRWIEQTFHRSVGDAELIHPDFDGDSA